MPRIRRTRRRHQGDLSEVSTTVEEDDLGTMKWQRNRKTRGSAVVVLNGWWKKSSKKVWVNCFCAAVYRFRLNFRAFSLVLLSTEYMIT